jgi:hypothetical protein
MDQLLDQYLQKKRDCDALQQAMESTCQQLREWRETSPNSRLGAQPSFTVLRDELKALRNFAGSLSNRINYAYSKVCELDSSPPEPFTTGIDDDFTRVKKALVDRISQLEKEEREDFD